MEKAVIAVVTYNSSEVIGQCLDACLALAGENTGFVVVDNASSDGTLEEVRRRPEVRLIANPENRGFAAAVNQAVQSSSAPFLLLLNPDAELRTGLEKLEAACERGAAAVGGKLIGEDGKPQAGFAVRGFPTPAALSFEVLGLNRLWPSNPVNRKYRCRGWDPEKAAEVEQPAGAFLMIRRDAWQTVGGFDEGFHPLWFEDVDYCRRLRDNGFSVQYEPGAVAAHRGAHSIRNLGWECRNIYWYGSLLRYAVKHFRPPGRVVVCLSTGAGAILRGVSGLWTEKSLKPLAVFGHVAAMALRCLWSGQAAGSERGLSGTGK
jgi:GT2 family glycosyltransferase